MAITINHQTNTLSATSGNLLVQNGLTAGSASVGHISYNGTTAATGQFDGGAVAPSATTRLNYNGNFYATNFFGNFVGSAASLTGVVTSFNGASGAITYTAPAITSLDVTTALGYTPANTVSITNETVSSSTYYPLLTLNTSGSLTTSNTSSTVLYFVPSTGTLNATNFNSLSDVRKKENIKTIDFALNKVLNMRGVSYTWKNTQKGSYGLIAQELENILPELVSTDEKGEKSVGYGNIVGVLIEAIKEQQKMIEEQEKRIRLLEAK